MVGWRPVIYETARLVVREYTPEDGAFVLDMYSRWDVMRFLGSAPKVIQDRSEAAAAIERWRSLSAHDPLEGRWAITRRDDGAVVGTVMLQRLPLSGPTRPLTPSDDYEVGWHLHPDHWGQGYATEAAAAAVQRGFDAGLAEIFAIIYPENTASKRVAERLGMGYVGRSDRYYGIEADLYRTTLG
jgi:RimJ/RimL family protein N-acetyltransferase